MSLRAFETFELSSLECSWEMVDEKWYISVCNLVINYNDDDFDKDENNRFSIVFTIGTRFINSLVGTYYYKIKPNCDGIIVYQLRS